MSEIYLLKASPGFLDLKYFSSDFYGLVFLLSVSLLVNFILIRLIYYPNSEKKKEYMFSFFLTGFIVFLLGFVLKSDQIKTGVAFGLFAVLSVIRIRTNLIPIKEMSYFFVIIGLSLVLSLAKKINLSIAELGVIIGGVLLMSFLLELFVGKPKKTEAPKKVKDDGVRKKNILYGNLDKIKPQNRDVLLEDIKTKTGLNITKIEVGALNLKKGEASLVIHYLED
jgi:hypothetical protein